MNSSIFMLGTRRYNFQPIQTPTLSATMHSVTDRRTDRRQHHAKNRSYCVHGAAVRSAKTVEQKYVVDQKENSSNFFALRSDFRRVLLLFFKETRTQQQTAGAAIISGRTKILGSADCCCYCCCWWIPYKPRFRAITITLAHWSIGMTCMRSYHGCFSLFLMV